MSKLSAEAVGAGGSSASTSLPAVAQAVADRILEAAGLSDVFYQLEVDVAYRLNLPHAGENSDLGDYLPFDFAGADCVQVLPFLFYKNVLNVAYYRWSLADCRHFRDDRGVPLALWAKEFATWFESRPTLMGSLFMLVYLPSVRANMPTLWDSVNKAGSFLPDAIVGDDHYYVVPLFLRTDIL